MQFYDFELLEFKFKLNGKLMFISEDKLLELAKVVSNKYCMKGVIPKKEVYDIKMSIVEKFLQQESKIASMYKGEAKKSTYCIAVLNRMCCEVIRKDIRHWDQEANENIILLDGTKTDSKVLIKDEVKYLDKILDLFSKEKDKINISLSHYYNFKVLECDLEKYDYNYKKNDLLNLLNSNNSLKKGEKLNNLCRLINIVENKNLKPDAIRMWLNKTRTSIIARLNGSFKRSNYDEGSLQLLYEYYYVSRKN